MSNAQRWVKQFKEGDCGVVDKLMSGRSSSALLMTANVWMSLFEAASYLSWEVHMFCGCVMESVTGGVPGYHGARTKWVPEQLTQD